MSERTGSCHCGAVKYRIDGDVQGVANCHCGVCKKLTGGPFSSIVMAKKGDLSLLQGDEVLSDYVVSDLATRYFCSRCGSTVYMHHAHMPQMRLLPLGSLDEPAAVEPGMNIFCESMLPWVREIEKRKNFEQSPG